MTDKTLYRYLDENNHTVVSPIQPTGVEYTLSHRLIADEGKELVKGEIRTCCIDTDDIEGWTEVEEITLDDVPDKYRDEVERRLEEDSK